MIIKSIKFVGFLLVSLLFGSAAWGAIIGHVEAVGQPLDKVLHRAIDEIEIRTEGRVSFTIFPSSQIGGGRTMTESVQLGLQEAVVIPAAFIGGFNPQASILDIPYLMPTDPEQANELRTSEFGAALLKTFGDHGLNALAFWPGGFKHFTSNRPLVGVESFRGQRFRIMDSRVLNAQFQALGAAAIQIPFSDVYTALQTGVVEGQENPLDSIARMKFHEVQDYLMLSSHGVVENIVLFNSDYFSSLSEMDQKTIQDVFEEMMPILGVMKDKNQEVALEEIREAGVNVVEISDEEQQKLRDIMYPIAREEYLRQAGEKGERLIQLYEQDYQRIINP